MHACYGSKIYEVKVRLCVVRKSRYKNHMNFTYHNWYQILISNLYCSVYYSIYSFIILCKTLMLNCYYSNFLSCSWIISLQRWGRFRHCGTAIAVKISWCWTDPWLYAGTWWRAVFSSKRESVFLHENSAWSWKIHGIWFLSGKLEAWCI